MSGKYKVKLILVCASRYSPFGLASTVCSFNFAGRRASSAKSYEEASEDIGTLRDLLDPVEKFLGFFTCRRGVVLYWAVQSTSHGIEIGNNDEKYFSNNLTAGFDSISV